MSTVRIIDVSSHNGTINWQQVKAAGVTDVIIRLSLGFNDRDTKAATYAAGASAAGLRVGYYHFAYPDTRTGGTVENDARAEAGWFTGLFANGALPAPSWLAVDLEAWSTVPPKDSPLNKADYLKWVVTFLDTVHARVGPQPPCMIYGSAGYLDAHLPADHGLGGVPLWVAHYTTRPSPTLPRGWTDHVLWQFSENGSVPGITGACDVDRSRYSAAVERAAARFRT